MAGNAKPRGAVRKSKKGPSAGTGGNNKRRLEGKGPTPKAEDRPYHAAAKRKKAAEKSAAKKPATAARKFSRGDAPRGASPRENLRAAVAGFLAALFSAAFLRFAAA